MIDQTVTVWSGPKVQQDKMDSFLSVIGIHYVNVDKNFQIF